MFSNVQAQPGTPQTNALCVLLSGRSSQFSGVLVVAFVFFLVVLMGVGVSK
jgi:hypothetical protein